MYRWAALGGGALLASVIASGCTTSEDRVRARAASDFACDESLININPVEGTTTYRAEGCGQHATYTCDYRGGICTHDEGPADVIAQARAAKPNDEASRAEGNATATDGGAKPLGEAPEGGAGFAFAATEDAIRAACEAAGHTYTTGSPGSGVCDGAAVDVGAPARVRVVYCASKACAIAVGLAVEHDENLTSAIVRWRRALVEKYGQASRIESDVPDECEHDLAACLADHRAKLQVVWDWPSHKRITLAPMVSASGKGGIVINYAWPEAGRPPGL
jgi:hypothetical protein